MDESDFEGTVVLERFAELNMIDDFFEAIDNDDFKKVIKLMKLAEIDQETIAIVLQKMNDADGNH